MRNDRNTREPIEINLNQERSHYVDQQIAQIQQLRDRLTAGETPESIIQ